MTRCLSEDVVNKGYDGYFERMYYACYKDFDAIFAVLFILYNTVQKFGVRQNLIRSLICSPRLHF